jgi:NAD(P)-dependent dehydrogenase (short-subunit alcohol dehydrogenase family)
MAQLENKVAIVTGAASGIGRATARLMAAEGARVLVADIDESGAGAVVAEIAAAGWEASALRVDVRDETAVKTMIEAALDLYGRLDILDNNAHTGRPEDTDIVATTRETWDEVLAGTLFGVVYGCKYGVPAMLRTGGGSIINVSSNAYLGGDFVRVAYGAAKSGVNSVTKYTATAFGRQGIRCNVLSPGVLVTPPVLRQHAAELAVIAEHVMAPRMGEPEDGARLAVFLGSDASSFINGQLISVDGGLNVHLGSVTQLHAVTSAARGERDVGAKMT